MEFNGVTFRRPPTVPEQEFPPGVIVDSQLRVWAMSRWRSSEELARVFLACGFRHLNLPAGSPRMFHLDHQYEGNNNHPIGLVVTFRNPRDAAFLLGQVFWCGCEFIAFTTYNVYTNFHFIFPRANYMHSLPYHLPEDE